MNPQAPECVWLDARDTVTLADLGGACGLSADELCELVEYGALVPLRAGDPTPVFSAEYVAPLREAGRLRLHFDLDLFAVALLLGYIHRVGELERQVNSLRAHLPARLHAPREGPQPWHEPHAGQVA